MSKKKVILSTIALLLVMAVAVSVVSYSIATKGHGDKNIETVEQGSMTKLGAELGADYVTNIDLIIENAVANGETFNIVEVIPSGTTPSDLSAYVTSGSFAQYVITANKENAVDDMPEDMVTYNALEVNASTALTDVYNAGTGQTVQQLLDSADLIYLSSPSYTSYNGDNNISEDVYNYLHVYATSKNKPIIMDFVTSTSSATAGDTYGSLVDAISRNHIKFRTYEWKSNVSVADFFSAKESYYLKYNVNSRTSNGKVLVIADSATPGTDSISGKMQAESDSDVIKSAYYGLTSKLPTDLDYTVITATALTVADLETQYDFIILEDGIKSVSVPADVFTKLRALSESSKYIFYDSRLLSTDTGEIEMTANNYLKLMQMLISTNGVELKTNVLAINYGFFTSLHAQGADGVDGAKAIAELINDTIYRDTDKTGANGKKYRVLEIQPCYPVDLDVAATKTGTTKYAQDNRTGIVGAYYSRPNEVFYGFTKDEVEEDTEYYAFEMSKAKIAHATGIDYSQIEVIQMSANELISSKEVISEEFDFVYIGGDASALVPHTTINYPSADLGGLMGGDIQKYIKAFTAFNMYSHTGHFVTYNGSMGFGRVAGGDNAVTFNGYDLSTTKRDELMDYVDSGLPVIVDKLVADKFIESYNFDASNPDCTNPNRLEQLSLQHIDPDSNMYQALAYIYEKNKTGKSVNIGWGMIDAANDERQVENVKDIVDAQGNVTDTIDRAYGNTLGSSVTVYTEECEKKIANMVEVSAKRPSIVLSEYPTQYVEGDKSTTNTSEVATFKASVKTTSTDVTASTYTMTLYVDANGDGTYAETEEVDSTTCGLEEVVTLTHELDEDFFGLVNWKIKVTDSNGKLCDIVKGNAFFKVTEDMKKSVRILQIMPVSGIDVGNSKIDDGHALYFCTECQQATGRLSNNVVISNNVPFRINLESKYDVESVFGVNVGKHEHDFGIVKYDPSIPNDNSTTTVDKGNDDWESNFADELTHGDDPETDEEEFVTEFGDYEFDLEILNTTEFEALCKAANGRSEETIEAAAEMADEKLVEYEEALASATLTGYRTTLEEEIYKAVESIRTSNNAGAFKNVILEGFGTEDNPGQWMLDQEYYKLWEYFNDKGSQAQSGAIANFDTLKTAYTNYITEYDKAVELKEQYKTNLKQSGDQDTWLLNNYDVIILGLADEFGKKDLSTTACAQLKTYTEQGGAILNTHDTVTAKTDGAETMSEELRATFGMDRFHVLGVPSDDTEVTVEGYVHAQRTFEVGYHYNYKGTFVVNKRDIDLVLDNDNNIVSATEVGDEKALGEMITITVTGGNPYNAPHYREQGTENGSATGSSFQVEQGKDTKTATFNIGTENVTGIFELSTGTATVSNDASEISEDGIKVELNVTDNGNTVPDGTEISITFRGKKQTASTIGGVAIVYLDLSAYGSPYAQPTGDCNYRQYITKDPTKYFWTERLKAASPADYAKTLADAGVSVRYNAPVGINDLWAAFDSKSIALSPFRYADMAPEAFDHESNVDGWNYEAKRGTRRVEKVNDGGVTMYPFTIADELFISPTHAQTFSLDLEDTSVAVWYTLAATYTNEKPSVGMLAVDAEFAHYSSSFYAASPRDGMSNYFLYSKENVFYTGAGHQLITGRLKDNNDERRLFINVICNAVTKGVTSPKLKLYNKCDTEGANHASCDCFYVDPKDKDANDELAKNVNTLYYNAGIEMYQYDIEENQTELYPEFDFKAIAGTADIKKIDVFYDLNYGEGDDMDQSDTYTADDNHVLISSYDKKDDMDGVRVRLREDIFPDTLKLEEEYFKNYKNYTYIVIRVQDEKGKWKSARVKINIIPYLFDLTDATSDYQKLPENPVVTDKFDKKQFNI